MGDTFKVWDEIRKAEFAWGETIFLTGKNGRSLKIPGTVEGLPYIRELVEANADEVSE